MSERLEDIAVAMVANGRGLLAADESTATIKKRFDGIGLESTETSRRDYREMLLRADDAMRDYISGVILYEETLLQNAADGTSLVDIIRKADSIPGIKVDAGAKPMAHFPNETITEGLDGLAARLAKYHEAGARFAKWRGVIAISNALPSRGAIRANAHALARYAALCQEAKIVPIVEPEVLMDGAPGDHSIERSEEVTEWTLRTVFEELGELRVKLEGMILKPSMVIDGKKARKASVDEVAERTIKILKRTVPAAVPGIAFLSGGQSTEEATAHLSAMNAAHDLPWKLTFSYGRALQQEALNAWGGKAENVAAGQRAFTHRAKMCSLAAKGSWTKDFERAA
ncbi:fructose-bisphosphate aldolase class I [Sinorhizobium medicae]|uniref:class I fructose-bisphosphate aldolase n=3 Tax=Sinorhizobium medicae TaxID=110321 RepID=UPI0004127B7A|nr:class I fructose-bisphosphate aldolase [Sinorhizobium medicae]MBO1943035.1 fructose-bisphosphate aldolase class I [Sinorhizobium medicae]MDX0429240.1 fructose-bisphosphate aldolase class I [Sinorhizobium medicae]MDX0441780.1 fructose-bisphosphate aldolase class I [Sinorhizobium medicae]MDX0459857.1 fructose-bisphosphate aldolase class I [Sinorhizobium medicae]MDX0484710.1 fructose-bisphosphate aldolase class I [Sinorhizobium medicae]